MVDELAPDDAATLEIERAAVRRVVRAAAEHGPDAVFAAINEEVARIVSAEASWLIHFDVEESIVLLGFWGPAHLTLPVGTRQLLSDELRAVRASGRPYRVEAKVPSNEVFNDEARRLGIRSSVGVPVMLGGHVWGLIVAAMFSTRRFPEVTEARMASFVEQIAPPLVNAQILADLQYARLVQAALRRVAEVASRGRSADEVLRAVAVEASVLMSDRPVRVLRIESEEASARIAAVSGGHATTGTQLQVESDVAAARVVESGRAVRIDDYANVAGGAVDRLGIRAIVGVPINVRGRLWGVLESFSPDEPLPPEAEHRLSDFADVAAAAIASAQSRDEVQQLADEQAALLRVSQLVATGAQQEAIFQAVVNEASGLINDEGAHLVRWDGPRSFTVLATCGAEQGKVGVLVEIAEDDRGTADEVLRTHRAARRDDYKIKSRPRFLGREYEVGSSVAVPIIVEGRLWGMIGSLTEGRRLPTGTEHRLTQFADLVGAAIASGEARSEVQQLAQEQAALLRVAELVARGAPLNEVFDEISHEASRLLGDLATALMRFDDGGFAVVVAKCSSPAPVGLTVPLNDESDIALLFRSGRPFRVPAFDQTDLADLAHELGVGAGAAVPITVEGRIWGALTTSTSGTPLAPTAETQLAQFSSLAAAAIANAEAKTKLIASRARVVATADETRVRLQRDVHDGAQQRLVQTVLTLKMARDAASNGLSTAGLIDEALHHAERATSDLRDLVHGILPASLSRGGLRSGLESFVADIVLPVHLELSAPSLPAETETSAYFIVAEALTNVVKHSNATEAYVRVDVTADQLIVEVTDDGVGGVQATNGSGLTGLRDRVEALEGTLSISSPVGAGTTIRASLPVAPK